jgi:hypothetical protein
MQRANIGEERHNLKLWKFIMLNGIAHTVNEGIKVSKMVQEYC